MKDMGALQYADLVDRYGERIAQGLLETIESLAKIQHGLHAPYEDEEARLARALEVIDKQSSTH